jgi:L-cysteine desulfidase
LDAVLPFIETIKLDRITFMQKGLEVNKNFAKQSLEHMEEYNLSLLPKDLVSENIIIDIKAEEFAKVVTTAAIKARMKGFPKPVFTCGGSGNQGLMASLPLIVYGERVGSNPDILLRAVVLSFLITIYIKAYIGPFPPICGCGIAASTGVGCGIVYLMGGRKKEIDGVIKNMVGATAGMICDGAKSGCAFKGLLTVGMAFDSAQLALTGVVLSSRDYYAVVKAVYEVGFDIYPASALTLVGESGCGKSTTARSELA